MSGKHVLMAVLHAPTVRVAVAKPIRVRVRVRMRVRVRVRIARPRKVDCVIITTRWVAFAPRGRSQG